ncbi:hypothetical protein L6164_008688 [Bauhinia variegata]|uniref:Uncharacterized protein n=1 Tax=Bauhinia variegata TaxID=167791 RepID=A0ACB9PIT8_BAUVA|nr:hypothetical protein L6164_008688 [Bauhinia variegata]
METTNLPSVLEIAPGDNLDYSEVATRDTSNNSEIAQGNSHDDSVKKVYDRKYAPLYKAVRRGDLEDVMKFLEAHPDGVNAIISEIEETALHVAVTFEHLHIVKELVNKMQEGDLEWRNQFGETAFVTAACAGIIEMAKCMIEKNRNLPMIPSNTRSLPVTMAVLRNKKEMARYLYSVTTLEELKPENGRHGANLLQQCFLSEAIDFTLDLVRRCPELAITLNEDDSTLLWSLATRPSNFPSGCQLLFWERWIYNWIQIEPATAAKDIRINIERSNAIESNDMTSIVPNTCHGLLRGLVVYIFNLIGIKKIHKLKLTHAKVFNRIYGVTSAIRDDLVVVKDKSENTALHMAALMAPSEQLNWIPGAALQMQRELQWFKFPLLIEVYLSTYGPGIFERNMKRWF